MTSHRLGLARRQPPRAEGRIPSACPRRRRRRLRPKSDNSGTSLRAEEERLLAELAAKRKAEAEARAEEEERRRLEEEERLRIEAEKKSKKGKKGKKKG